MTEPSFTNREVDAKLKAQTEEMKAFIKGIIEPLTIQVTYTNGKVRRLERNLLIVTCIVGTYLVLNYPQVIKIIQIFI